ncbi:MAG TPA: DUF58 domain-containing protein [Anaerolineae bacterium]|nr:DUF58 domain-containing protein [Anaerolineae bacterium]
MLLTRRFLVLALLAAVPIAAAAYAPWLLWAGTGYAALVLGLVLADYALSPGPDDFEVGREHDTRLSLGAWNPIRVVVRSTARRAVRIAVRDEPPPAFALDEPLLHGRVAARDTTPFTYHARPPRRGDYQFGDLNLRWWGVLGLVVRQARYPGSEDRVKVYPNLLDVHKYELLVRRGRLHELGLRTSRLLGMGTEFERLREYQPDDEYRRINWKATARRRPEEGPVSNEFETERSQNIVAVLDTGRLMSGPVGDLTKMDCAINAVLMLAYVATLRGDKVGLMTFADRVEAYLAPRHGKGQFYRMLELLYAVESQPVEPDYRRSLAYLAVKQQKRALVVCFTDLAGGPTARALLAGVGLLKPRHLPLCVTVSDPGIVALAEQRPHDSAAAYERAIAGRLLDERQITLDTMRRGGVLTLDVPADRLTVAVINRYLELKGRTMI